MQLTPEEKITLENYNTIAKQWAKKHSTSGFWKKEMKIFKKFLPDGKILEIGCGGGRDAKELTALGYEYVGIDFSSGLIKVAKKENPNLIFLNQSIYNLNFSKRTQFDGFWVAAVLHHIPKIRIDEVLQRIKKFIKGGGIGFISVRQGEGEKFEEKVIAGVIDKRFFARYSKFEFSKILLRNNFEIISIKLHPIASEKITYICFFVKVLK